MMPGVRHEEQAIRAGKADAARAKQGRCSRSQRCRQAIITDEVAENDASAGRIEKW